MKTKLTFSDAPANPADYLPAKPDAGLAAGHAGEAAHKCKFCRSFVDLGNEGVTYSNGACAHESCADSNAFEKANESDFRD